MKICVVTSTRADFGLLRPLIKEIRNDSELTLQLIATGTHLSKEFGETYKEIESDFKIDKKIAMGLSDDSHLGTSRSMAHLQISVSETLSELSPDIVVILGDRYEILSVAISCMMLNIPIAHIHGGETTQGAIDEAIRHSITKMSHLHFTATDTYKKRVIQLGEQPKRVFNVGSLGVESIQKLKLLDKNEFEKSIGFKLGKKNLLVTYHPTTLENQTSKDQFKELLYAIDELEDTNIIFTKSNADSDAQVINYMIDEYVKKNHNNTVAFESLGQLRYLSALQFMDAVVGNSSSGIIEVPSFNKATINIGDRQKGRERASSIIDVDVTRNDIKSAIEGIYCDEFKNTLKNNHNPYKADDTAKNIKNIIKVTPLHGILKKEFYDLKVQ